MMKWMPILRIRPKVTLRGENAGNTVRGAICLLLLTVWWYSGTVLAFVVGILLSSS